MKILQIVSNISLRSGVMAFLMNYYRFMDVERVRFDFLYYEDREQDYKNEISHLGGRVFKSPAPSSLRGRIRSACLRQRACLLSGPR